MVNAVANATGEPATPNGTADGAVGSAALSPLYERIDPDALDALLAAGTGREADCAVTFTYAGHRVTVSARSVSVTPRD